MIRLHAAGVTHIGELRERRRQEEEKTAADTDRVRGAAGDDPPAVATMAENRE